MGTIIKATGVSLDPTIRSSVTHAAQAAQACIRAAGIRMDEIDLLINTGIYRDNNMVEPSMAALVQKEIGLSLDYVKEKTGRSTFSFDLMNGSCGVLNAAQLAGAALQLGSAKYVLVVSSDAHPSNQPAADFPYATLGSAMLLERSSLPTQGFGRIQLQAQADDYVGLEAISVMGAKRPDVRGSIEVREQPEYKQRLLAFAVEAARAYVTAEGIDLTKTLLVTSQPTPTFGVELARALGIDEAAVVNKLGIDADPHSSALTLGYHRAVERGEDQRFENILFVGANAGLTSACALYRR